MIGSPTVTCSATGNWDTAPKCEQLVCGLPPLVKHADPIYTSQLSGSTCNYKCQAGYTLLGSSITCTTKWSTPPICQPNQCPAAPAILGGTHVSSGTKYLSVARYACNSPKLLVGPDTITCQADKTWSGNPKCEDPYCGYPPIVQFATRTFTSQLYNSQAQYTCVTGYKNTATTTQMYATCQNNKSWAPVPACERKTFT
ncbi:C4b-binding protein alpha chain-like [Tubulanus polymorphus]|uniref:C4b-binding protein alpha chain-like n=1 Tax=Tubulanus polymorphus TaxID=672921 RepID=UPI003DA20E92